MPLQSIASVKGHAVSDDGSQVAVAFATKDGGELSVMMPSECLDALVTGLNKAKTAAKNKQSGKGGKADQVSVSMPKTWMVTADLQVHGVVLLILDPKTEAQVGYALDADAAKKMAAGLVKNADAVLTSKASPKKTWRLERAVSIPSIPRLPRNSTFRIQQLINCSNQLPLLRMRAQSMLMIFQPVEQSYDEG